MAACHGSNVEGRGKKNREGKKLPLALHARVIEGAALGGEHERWHALHGSSTVALEIAEGERKKEESLRVLATRLCGLVLPWRLMPRWEASWDTLRLLFTP